MNYIIVSIIAASEIANGIPSGLLESICMVESKGNHNVISYYDGDGTHSLGLCQVKLNTARMFNKKIKEKDLLNPTINANIAGKYLKYQYNRYNSWNKAVVAYNKGNATNTSNSYSKKVTKEWIKVVKKKPFKKDPHEVLYEGTPLFGVYKNGITYRVYFVNPSTFRVVEGSLYSEYNTFDNAFNYVLEK